MKKIRIEIPVDSDILECDSDNIRGMMMARLVLNDSWFKDAKFEVIETTDIVPVDEIESTDWAKATLRDCGEQVYREALDYMKRRVNVWIEDADAFYVCATGTEFSLEGFDEKADALVFCKRFGLEVVDG